ncbi:hypothetical protein JS562_55545, partial [Agrobacterium sp. S2]|nr:hypothetical protein [Agrobacterium sp. S2]
MTISTHNDMQANFDIAANVIFRKLSSGSIFLVQKFHYLAFRRFGFWLCARDDFRVLYRDHEDKGKNRSRCGRSCVLLQVFQRWNLLRSADASTKATLRSNASPDIHAKRRQPDRAVRQMDE